MPNNIFDFQEFEKDWTRLAKEICLAVYADLKVKQIKETLKKNQFLTSQQQSEFINIFNETKYKLIYSKFGQEGSEGYQNFSRDWQIWFQRKGVQSQQERKQRGSVDHILFGSTPDPNIFLLHFEEEESGKGK